MSVSEANQSKRQTEPYRFRSPLLLDRKSSALLVVDVQEKLVPHIARHARVVWNIKRLIDGAQLLQVPVAATEQYPQGLGSSVAEVRDRISSIPAKSMFSCRECHDIFSQWEAQGIRQVVIIGIETHVCVLQTALDLIAAGLEVYVVADATGTRHDEDHTIGLRRIELSGGWITTTESVLFEWCEVSGTDDFKQISQLVRQKPPTA